MKKVFVAAAALALAGTASAQMSPPPGPSPRYGSFEVSLGGYRPRVDAEFNWTATPFASAFGNGRALMFRGDFSWSIFQTMGLLGYGALDLGVGAGYSSKTGNGLMPDGSRSTDTTTFKVVPTRVTLTYRVDLLEGRWGIPFVPYARLALDRYFWWTENGSGDVSNANGRQGSGATMGWSLGGGIAFLLDVLDPSLAREMDRDTGINHTYVFVDFTKSWITDFRSSTSWDISDDQVTISGGLLFVF